jgi:hypothetical protein
VNVCDDEIVRRGLGDDRQEYGGRSGRRVCCSRSRPASGSHGWRVRCTRGRRVRCTCGRCIRCTGSRRGRWGGRRRDGTTATGTATPFGVHQQALLKCLEDLHDAALESSDSVLSATAVDRLDHRISEVIKKKLRIKMEAKVLYTAAGYEDALPIPPHGCHIGAMQ